MDIIISSNTKMCIRDRHLSGMDAADVWREIDCTFDEEKCLEERNHKADRREDS